MLVAATTAQEGEPLSDLVELYDVVVGQWTTELNHVVSIVGGATSQAKNAGQRGVVFTPISGQRQREAVAFLNRNAFAPPVWLLDPEVLRRIESSGALNRIRDAQVGVLNALLDSGRFARIVEQEALDPKTAWSPADFLATVRSGVWRELSGPQVRIDAYRRNLQRAYLDLATGRVTGANSEERSLYRADLQSLDAAIRKTLGGVANRETRAHLAAAREQISRALDPRGVRPTGVSAVPNPKSGATNGFAGFDGEDCFPDYATVNPSSR